VCIEIVEVAKHFGISTHQRVVSRIAATKDSTASQSNMIFKVHNNLPNRYVVLLRRYFFFLSLEHFANCYALWKTLRISFLNYLSNTVLPRSLGRRSMLYHKVQRDLATYKQAVSRGWHFSSSLCNSCDILATNDLLLRWRLHTQKCSACEQPLSAWCYFELVRHCFRRS
jgi:hypothetical protein